MHGTWSRHPRCCFSQPLLPFWLFCPPSEDCRPVGWCMENSLWKSGVTMYIYIFLHVMIIFKIHTHISIHMHIYIYTCYTIHTSMCVYIDAYIHTYMHACMHAYIHTQKWRFGRCSSLPHKSEHSADIDPVGTYDVRLSQASILDIRRWFFSLRRGFRQPFCKCPLKQ